MSRIADFIANKWLSDRFDKEIINSTVGENGENPPIKEREPYAAKIGEIENSERSLLRNELSWEKCWPADVPEYFETKKIGIIINWIAIIILGIVAIEFEAKIRGIRQGRSRIRSSEFTWSKEHTVAAQYKLVL